jgi:hypothetical protein
LSDNTHACLSDYNHWKLGPQCGECAVEARAGIPPGANPTSRQQVVLPSAPISKPKQSRVPTPIIGSILGVLRPGSQNTGPLPHRPIKASPNRNLKQKHRPKAPLWAWFAVTPIAMGLSGLTVSVDTKWVKLLMIGAFLPIGIISFGWMLRSIARYASASGAAGRQHTQTFVKAVLFSSWVVVHIGAGLGTGMATSPLTDLSRAVSIWSWETPFEQQPNDDTISAHRSTSIDSHVRNAIDWVLPAAVRTPHRGIYWSSSGMSGSVTSRGPSADSPGCHFVEVYISSSVNPSSVNPVGAYACPDSRGRYTLRM